jgi:hypothetical protein
MSQKKKKLGLGGWAIIITLLLLLAAATAYAIDIWTAMDTTMSGFGWGFLIAGVVVSIALGGGLMALVFYSAKNNYDR